MLENKITQADTRFNRQMMILASMYLGYMALYMIRATVVVVSPAMLEDPNLGMTLTDWGAILGWSTAGTLLGKLTTGIVADKLGGRWVFLCSICVCIVTASVFVVSSYLVFFAVAYFCMLFAKSAGWPAMANLISLWYPSNWRGRIWGVIASSSRFSAIATTLAMGGLLFFLDWRSVIAVAIFVLVVVFVVLSMYLKQKPADVGISIEMYDDAEQHPTHVLNNTSITQALKVFATSSRVWLICISVMCLTVLMEFQSFIPIYLQQTFSLSPGAAAMTSAAFPIGSLCSVVVGGFIYDRLSKIQRVYVLGGMMLLIVPCFATLMVVTDIQQAEVFNLWTALAVIMLFGLLIAPCYYIPMSVFSVDFGGKHCGLLVGIIDAIGYSAAIFFDFQGAALADESGFRALLQVLMSVSVVATIALVMFLVLEYRRNEQQVI